MVKSQLRCPAVLCTNRVLHHRPSGVMRYAAGRPQLLVLSTKASWKQLCLITVDSPRITACLEEKIWSFFKGRNLTPGNKILWIRGEIAPKEQFLPFSTTFSIYIFNFRSQITYLFVKFGCTSCIFSQFCKSVMSKYGYLEVFQRVHSTSR